MTVYVAEIVGRAIAAFNADDDAAAQELRDDGAFQSFSCCKAKASHCETARPKYLFAELPPMRQIPSRKTWGSPSRSAQRNDWSSWAGCPTAFDDEDADDDDDDDRGD